MIKKIEDIGIERLYGYRIVRAKCLKYLCSLPSNCVDAVVTDPPAAVSFMSMDWDRDKGGRTEWIKWLSSIMAECFRALKPGGHALVWALPRTSHWTATAIEDVGFEMRGRLTHLFSSGFPKSHNVGNAIDKHFGASNRGHAIASGSKFHPTTGEHRASGEMLPKYEARTEQGKPWEGYGTAIKPAVEDWIIGRKPLSEKNVALNILRWGIGALNIDICRIQGPRGKGVWGTSNETINPDRKFNRSSGMHNYRSRQHPGGRWPADLLLSHSENCIPLGTVQIKGSGTSKRFHPPYPGESVIRFHRGFSSPANQHADPETGLETVERWDCSFDCPVAMLDAHAGYLKSGMMKAGQQRNQDGGYHGDFPKTATEKGTYGDAGAASRFFNTFFYSSKASRREREAGLRGILPCIKCKKLNSRTHPHEKNLKIQVKCVRNSHPTVKNLKLMSHLVRLVTPPNGIVLDPFMGTASTGIAAIRQGMRFLGVESDRQFFKIARARMRHTWGMLHG